MDPVHLHLILNHIPVLGAFFSLALLAWSFVRRSEEMKQLALVVTLIAGMSAGPAYLTGEKSEDAFEKKAGESAETFLEPHEKAAKIALTLALITGGAAGVLLFYGLRKGETPDMGRNGIALLAFVLAISMSYTANLGGKAAHPEIRGTAAVDSGGGKADAGGSKDGKSRD